LLVRPTNQSLAGRFTVTVTIHWLLEGNRLSGRAPSADQLPVRKLKNSLILNFPRTPGPLWAGLPPITQSHRSAVPSPIGGLFDNHFVREIGVQPLDRARPSMPLELDPEAGVPVGVETREDSISFTPANSLAQELLRQPIASYPHEGDAKTVERTETHWRFPSRAGGHAQASALACPR
jgi:hypothetical protein